ncbi:hypothetical protein B0H10DRAFT_2168048 [Mycena sp. CBHHK59/15]|nr:hypothetical protein B0H10DRAFT_2168048 [Mycena sp. CBHHK59/15]
MAVKYYAVLGRKGSRRKYNYFASTWGLSQRPPTFRKLRAWEAALPQHNLELPFPEGKTGRYVKFSNQASQIGWNNCFNEVLMNAHLAYISKRAYVFQDYVWSPTHYPWPKSNWLEDYPRTPLPAIVSGPVAGGPFDSNDTAPRSVSSAWFDVVCPPDQRRYINTREVKPAVAGADGIEVLTHWQHVLLAAPERCIEITFDLGLWGSPRLLSTWDSFSASPMSRLLGPSPIVGAAVDRNTHLFRPRGPRPPHPAPRDPFARMLAMHLRRGDYEGHCRWMTYINMVFYSWNLFPFLPDRFVSDPDGAEKDDRFLERCWPNITAIVEKAAQSRRDYLAHAADAGLSRTLDVMYILTNEKGEWIDKLKNGLNDDGWVISSSEELTLDAEQKDVSMAVDMEIARRAAVFIGNGWSSFTSNIVHQRLVDGRDPITIRFT